MNDETHYTITPKGQAFLAYLKAQEAAADTGDAHGLEDQLDYFQSQIFAPIEKHVSRELIRGLVEIGLEDCEDPKSPSFEELDKVAFGLGASLLEAYSALLALEDDDA